MRGMNGRATGGGRGRGKRRTRGEGVGRNQEGDFGGEWSDARFRRGNAGRVTEKLVEEHDLDCEDCVVTVCAGVCCVCEPRGILACMLLLSLLFNMGWFSLFHSSPSTNIHSQSYFPRYIDNRAGEPLRPQPLAGGYASVPDPIMLSDAPPPMNKELMRCLNLDALWRSDRSRTVGAYSERSSWEGAKGQKEQEQMLWTSLECDKHLKSLDATNIQQAGVQVR